MKYDEGGPRWALSTPGLGERVLSSGAGDPAVVWPGGTPRPGCSLGHGSAPVPVRLRTLLKLLLELGFDP